MRHSDIPMRQDTAKHIKEVRKILFQGRSEPELLPIALSEQEEAAWIYLKSVCSWIFIALFIFAILCCLRGCLSDPAWSAEIPQEKAIRVIVGEASNQGFKGMVCVAEVIRHKGSLKGFYVLHAPHSAHEPKWVWNMARIAWYRSKTTNLTKYADHFENIHAFGCPYWIRNCVKTFSYRDHVFYKEVV